MPNLEYWFSGTALYLAASFAFAIIVGLVGIKEIVSRSFFFVLMGAAIVLTTLAWRTAAKQEQDNTELTNGIISIARILKAEPSRSAKALADEIIKLLPAKYPLTDAEKERLIKVLRLTPQDQRFEVELYWPQLNGTRGYADAMAKVFKSAGWDVTVRMAALVNGHGLTFALPKAAGSVGFVPAPKAVKMMNLFASADLPFAVGHLDNVPEGTFAFVVGQPPSPAN